MANKPLIGTTDQWKTSEPPDNKTGNEKLCRYIHTEKSVLQIFNKTILIVSLLIVRVALACTLAGTVKNNLPILVLTGNIRVNTLKPTSEISLRIITHDLLKSGIKYV